MEELRKEDAEVLDQILGQLKESHYFHLEREKNLQDCLLYFGILKKYPEIVRCNTAKGQYQLSPSTNTEEFKRNGGFVGLYNKQQEERRKKEERENIIHSNNVLINKDLRFKDKFRIPLFMISIIGQISGVIFGTIKLFSNNNGETNNSTPLTISLILMIIGVIAGVIFGWKYLLSNNNGETNN